jgi:hypothetical protein
VVQIVKIWVGINVAKGKTVELSIGQGVHYVGLQVKLALKTKQKLMIYAAAEKCEKITSWSL